MNESLLSKHEKLELCLNQYAKTGYRKINRQLTLLVYMNRVAESMIEKTKVNRDG